MVPRPRRHYLDSDKENRSALARADFPFIDRGNVPKPLLCAKMPRFPATTEPVPLTGIATFDPVLHDSWQKTKTPISPAIPR
jgi:hypothetical protein